jgi:hypothetical protein
MTIRLNPDTFYRNGKPLGASFYQAIDTAQANAINGDTGGTWSGITTIGGAGMWFAGPTSAGIGAEVQTPFLSGKRIVHAANDVAQLSPSHVLRTRNMKTSCGAAAVVTNGFPQVVTVGGTYGALAMYPRSVAIVSNWTATTAYALNAFAQPSPLNSLYYRCTVPGTSNSTPPTWPTTLGTIVTDGTVTWICVGPLGYPTPARFVMPLRVHDAATFLQATLTVQTATHFALPTSWPAMRIYALDTSGNIFPLGGDPTRQGWMNFPAVSLGSWSAQSVALTYTINAGVVINRRAFQYICEVTDESGIAAASMGFPFNAYKAVLCAFTNIGSMYWP